MPKESVIIKSNVKKEPKEDVIESLLTKGKPLPLTEDEQKSLIKSIREEFDAIKAERGDIDGEDFDEFLESMERQRKGRMPKTADRAYNLDTGLTKVKCQDIIRTTIDALFGVDPKISINPRPGFAKGVGMEVCSQQQEFLDYALDERIPLRKPLRLACSSATYKKVGMVKWSHKVRKEKRIGHEKYVGKPIVTGVDPQGQPIIENKPLNEFLLAYGDVIEKELAKNPESTKYSSIIKKLQEGKKAEFDYEYDDVVYNDPFPKFVDNANFYVRKDTEGYIGLCEASLITERVSFSYYQLKQFEKEFDFVNIDKLIYDKGDDKPREGYASEKYDVLEHVYYAVLPEDEETGEYTKIVCWEAEKENLYLGGINYPYTVLDCYYVPHYVKCTDNGFYQEGVAEDITSPHKASNAILNHTLESAQMANTITPITEKGSDVANQFLQNTWTNGMPLYGGKDLDFLSNKMRPPDISGLLVLQQVVERTASDLSGVSGLRSGKETPLDPNAPGNKTIALLQETGKNIKDYVDEFKDGFNIDAQVILKFYYEMGQDEQEYLEKRQRTVTGAEPKKIGKSAMIARTSIQSQAMAYDFNKLNAKKEDLAMNAYLDNQSLIINNPQANYEKIRLTLSGWGPKWKNSIDKLLPPLEQFQQQQAQIALQAVAQYVQIKMKESQMTQQPPKMVPKELMGMIQEMQAMATMPANKAQEIQKAKQKAQKKGG